MQVKTAYSQQKEVKPVNPPAAYLGGKRLLSKPIIEKIKMVNHGCYAEPFFGMGGVFFRKPFQANCEVINDISTDVTTFLKVLKRHYIPFLDFMKWDITTRNKFDELENTDPKTLTDLERAARFFYLQRLSFGGKVCNRSFGTSTTSKARFNINRLESNLEQVHERLSDVQIENLDYSEFIRRYDRPHTLFYIDSPYFKCENDYGKGVFSREDFSKMAKQLFEIQGKFILSLNDTPEVREIFKAFIIEPVNTKYSVGKKTTTAKEVIISCV